jgi:hypothetical protein
MSLKESVEQTPGGGARPRSEFEVGAIEREVQRVLRAPAFRNSKQCQKFLHYVVEQSRGSREDLLRERVIGVELFGRPADYDTSTDPIVRVRANEVRKRLAQCYQEGGHAGPVRFEMPPGSYAVEFHWNSEQGTQEPATSEPRPNGHNRIFAAAVTTGIVIVAAALLYKSWPAHRASVVEQFWSPALQSPKPVVICSGHPVVYFLSRKIHESYRAKSGANPQAGPYVIKLDPDETIAGRDIVPVTDQYVGVGDAATSGRLLALFAELRKPAEVRFGNDVSFAELRLSPAVLIGAFSNRWTLSMTDELRFIFDQRNGVKMVVDRSVANRVWALKDIAPDGRTKEDYAIISRIFDSKTGQFLIAAAGITQYGTRAAGEFLTEASRITQALAGAPSDWAGKNMQVVIHTSIIGGMPGPPKVIAAQFW